MTPRPTHRATLGEMLRAAGAATEAQVAAALADQRVSGDRIGAALQRQGVGAEAVAQALAAQLRLPWAPPPLVVEPTAAALLDGAVAARLRVLPLAATDRSLRLAMVDPLDAAALDDVQFRTGRRAEPVVVSPAALEAGLSTAYGAGEVAALLSRLDGPLVAQKAAAPDHVRELRAASEAAPVVALVDLMLGRAIGAGASDLHIEPAERGLGVRARVDGLLRPLLELPAHLAPAVVSRLKIMAGLDIAVKRRPQDGRCVVRRERRELVLRVSTLPCVAGEKVVLRLLETGQALRTLADLDLAPHDRRSLRRLLAHDHGVILVTGPTGSGKTTTLYAALAALDRDRRNIVTLEDPVEYRLPGATQVQIHPRGGVTFATALRAVLRQDPDVVMVGELRDRETADVAMAAALTGHLVLSTLHTNDAATAVTRLLEMGSPPYLVAAGLIGVVAQRLVRRVCADCARPEQPDPDALRELGLEAPAAGLRAGAGCERCGGTGTRGRTPVFEVLSVDEAVRSRILRRAGADAVGAAARRAGLRSMGEDAWAKALAGVTTFEEARPLLLLPSARPERRPGRRGRGAGRRERTQGAAPAVAGIERDVAAAGASTLAT